MILTFIGASVINVILSTIKSITTIKSNKYVASIISGAYYAFYNLVLVLTVMEFPMWQKCLITFGSNLIGVYVVKYMDEKLKKDKLWKIETTIYSIDNDLMIKDLNDNGVMFCYNENGKHTLFSIWTNTKEESQKVSDIIKRYNGRYFITENCGVLI